MEKFQDRFFPEVAENLKRLGVKALVFDLDDTLIYTSEIFILYMNHYADEVSARTGIDRAVLYQELVRLNDEEYLRSGVNPARWQAVLESLGGLYPKNKEEIEEGLEILMLIYQIEPRMRVGAKETLEVLRDSGVKLILVTHANVEWTWRKLEQTKLLDYFDLVKIADENGHKGKEDWLGAVEEMELLPGECVFVGDSVRGDMWPGSELGARTVWIPSPWAMYATGNLPEETVKIEEIGELLSALESLR